MLQGREWSELGSRDIDGFAGMGNLRSERARASQYLPELGIYDYRHRMYHPILGRFLQTDPTGFDADDMNLFRYCGDDPVDSSDPTGLDTIFEGQTVDAGGMTKWTVTPEKGKPFSFFSNVFGNAPGEGGQYGRNGLLPPGEYIGALEYSGKFQQTVIKLYSPGKGNAPSDENDHTSTILYKGARRTDVEMHPYRTPRDQRPTDKEVAKAEKNAKMRQKLDKEFPGNDPNRVRSQGCITVKQRELDQSVKAAQETEGKILFKKY